MGYCVEIVLNNVVIPKDKLKEALRELNKLWGADGQPTLDARGGRYGPDGVEEKWYAWVDNPPEDGTGFRTLKKLFGAWRYRTVTLPNGDFSLEAFEGEKWGDDEILFKAMAPFVKSGAEIYCTGEDHEQWRYRFIGGEMLHQSAHLAWDDEAVTQTIETKPETAVMQRRLADGSTQVLEVKPVPAEMQRLLAGGPWEKKKPPKIVEAMHLLIGDPRSVQLSATDRSWNNTWSLHANEIVLGMPADRQEEVRNRVMELLFLALLGAPKLDNIRPREGGG